jgi:hypothetical protein
MAILATVVTDWLTAIGTVGAVIVAVGTPGLISLNRWRKRPSLDVVMGDVEPLQRFDPSPANPRELRLRALVSNSGKSSARRVRVQVQRCWLKPLAAPPNGPWTILDTDILPLRWSSRSPEDRGAAGEEVEIPPNLADRLDVLRVDWNSREMFLVGASREVPLAPHYDIGEYRIELVVVAENAPAVSHVYAFRKEQASRVLRPYRSAPPPEHEVGGAG